MFDNVTILTVDDDSMNLEMLELMLSELGGRILKAGNGREALLVMEQEPGVDVVLLDLEMPVMDGYETIKHIKQSFDWRDIPVIVVTAGTSEVTRMLALGANDFIPKPYNPEELRLRVMNHVRSKKLSDMTKNMNSILEEEVVKKTADLQKALKFSQDAEYEISIRLGKASEFRDQETGMHTRRISELSKELGLLARLSAEQCEILRKSSPLHDVGKIGIPDKILLKPGKLDIDEFEIMKQHTTIGGSILADAVNYPLLNAGAFIALQHHEKWDGSGYPSGMKGNDIHIYARIVMIVDVFDALSSERPYKKAFPLEKTLAIMDEGRGEFFDPDLYDLFRTHINSFVAIRETLKDEFEEHVHMSDAEKMT
ncbi:MAG TPA: response regulator [Desulfuromonadales bacterium]|nr:response regulator [Desulfuromonadales bacterium]